MYKNNIVYKGYRLVLGLNLSQSFCKPCEVITLVPRVGWYGEGATLAQYKAVSLIRMSEQPVINHLGLIQQVSHRTQKGLRLLVCVWD